MTPGGRHVGTVVAAHSLAGEDKTTDYALVGTLALAVVLLLALLAVVVGHDRARAAAGRGDDAHRRALERARDSAAASAASSAPDELGELARTFDALLDRVAASLRHEQRLSAELSHELRTPLARILAEMELLSGASARGMSASEAYEVDRSQRRADEPHPRDADGRGARGDADRARAQ